MDSYRELYASLNAAQRTAVDTIYGPVLVIAGPGTGKTQLLSARVAHILKQTDALPQNILCLTFTENGATNMRERLTRFIGKDAYDVAIGTYHSFGSTIIHTFPEYFTDLRLERPVDELGKRQIVADIIEKTAFRSPIKQTRHHLGDLMATISEVKRGLLQPDDLRAIAAENLRVIEHTKPALSSTLEPYVKALPRKLEIAEPLFIELIEALHAYSPQYTHPKIRSLAALAADDLATALTAAQDSGKTTPLTAWKNTWLVKDNTSQYMLAGGIESARIEALATVLEQYQAALHHKGLFDFDDMILHTIRALETNDSLRYTLQERYQFILLDEFQDTNAAQLRLVELLTNNPVDEGRPNVLAVGDDDQAIYAFQGAQYSNMRDFYDLYQDVTVVALEENYRSAPEILLAATAIANQIESRLHHTMTNITKQLTPRAKNLPPLMLGQHEYNNDVGEYTAIAENIAKLIKQGVAPEEIAVLAPKHAYLEAIVPYLQKEGVAVNYERRENILEAPVTQQLLTMSRLLLALQGGQTKQADSLWPQILSYDFWQFSTATIWRISWQAAETHKSWAEIGLQHKETKHAVLLLLTLAGQVSIASAETILDGLIGTSAQQTNDRQLPSVRSPLRDYYFKQQGEAVLFQTVNELSVLRAKFREHQTTKSQALTLADLMSFVAEYQAADQQMLNTSPYTQAEKAVRLMTVYKAKGLEFLHVFLPNCQDEVWGSKARGMGNKLTLPANLAHLRHAGTTEDERLRLFFVAQTRARAGLHLSSHRNNFAGKPTNRLKYFDELENDSRVINRSLPEGFQEVTQVERTAAPLEILELNWQSRHLATKQPDLKSLLMERLKSYQLSPTHLTHFLDLKYGGPESFLLGTLLKFPSAPSIDASYGNALHSALEFAQHELNKTGFLPTQKLIIAHAVTHLRQQPFSEHELQVYAERAAESLAGYLQTAQFTVGNAPEKSFREEGVFVGAAHMGGKIDLLEIDKNNRTITVVDYKTGQLGKDPVKLYRYTLQLYCYKLLVEGSHSYKGYHVPHGRIVFVDPDEHGKIVEKEVMFDATETERVKELLQALWQSVQSLKFPDATGLGDSMKDLRTFENRLLERNQN
ncbi:MAG: ATP-dependent DNA helicase [Candidatus Saccharimonadales bacterium]